MKKNIKIPAGIIILLLIIIILSSIYYIQNFNKSNKNINPINETNQTLNYCSAESRNAQVCYELYKPVCGWFDSSKIQCIKYPCAATYSNECFACQNSNVAYWTDGECPA
jgi:hypothetical protein